MSPDKTDPKRHVGMIPRCAKLLCALVLLAAVCRIHAATSPGHKHYVTWPPVEPDKSIAIWLMKTYVDPEATFEFVRKGSSPTNGIAFDIPGSVYIRNHRRCASEIVIHRHHIEDAKATALGALARKMEMNFWYATYTEREQPLADALMKLWQSDKQPEEVLEQALVILDEWQPQ